MDKKVLDFLTKNRISCLSVILPDSSVHGSTLHYSHQENPLGFFFSTEKSSRKCLGLLKGEVTKGSMVVGFSEEDWLTVQMDGEVMTVLDESELKAVKEIHYAKHPGSKQYEFDPETIFLKFTPTWWRYTDYNTKPITTISSE